MDKTGVAAKLRDLANGNDQRKEVAKLRAVFDDVEAALAAGVKRSAVLAVLRESGLNMSQGTFDTQVYRIRQSRKATAGKPTTAKEERSDKADAALAAETAPTEAPQVQVPDEAPAAHDSNDVAAQDLNVRYPDIRQSQEKARRYIGGPLDFDVDNLFKKGN